MIPLLAVTLWAGAAAPQTVPELFEGEMEDVGPQYLLLAATRPQRLEVWGETDLTGTSNATLVEDDPKSSTITSIQAGGTWHFTPRTLRGGQLGLEVGGRVQTYRYGLLADGNRRVNFLEIDRNDFDLAGVHAAASWRRDSWFAMAGLRGASLRNRGSGRVFYEEAAVEWLGVRQWRLGAWGMLTAGTEGAARWSWTDSYGLLPSSWNDRVEMGLIGVLDRPLGKSWRVQPALRVQGSHYTCDGRDREDVHVSLRVSVIRSFAKGELRLGLGYDRRDSSEAVIADFQKWDLGLGGRMQWRF